MSEADHAGFACSLIGTTWDSSGGPPMGSRWYVTAADGDRVQVVNLATSFRYWWNYRSIVAVAGMHRVA